jgi:hypothetical protein
VSTQGRKERFMGRDRAGRVRPARAVRFALLAATPFACVGDNNCGAPPEAELAPGAYEITQADDDPDLVGGTITVTTTTLTVNFERNTGPVQVVYEIGEQTF